MTKRKTRRPTTRTIAAGVEHKMTGPKAEYRGKVRVPVAVLLTPVGHLIMKQGQQLEELRRNDFFERLLRRYAKDRKLPIADEAPV